MGVKIEAIRIAIGWVFIGGIIAVIAYALIEAKPHISQEDLLQIAVDRRHDLVRQICAEVHRLDGRPPQQLTDEIRALYKPETALHPELQGLFDLSCNSRDL